MSQVAWYPALGTHPPPACILLQAHPPWKEGLRHSGEDTVTQARPHVQPILLATQETQRSWLSSPDVPPRAQPQDKFIRDEIKPSCFFILGKLKPQPNI